MNDPGMVTTLAWMVREPWATLTSTALVEKNLGCLQLDKKQGDLRVDLTEPEKAFDWIRIRKILGSI